MTLQFFFFVQALATKHINVINVGANIPPNSASLGTRKPTTAYCLLGNAQRRPVNTRLWWNILLIRTLKRTIKVTSILARSNKLTWKPTLLNWSSLFLSNHCVLLCLQRVHRSRPLVQILFLLQPRKIRIIDGKVTFSSTDTFNYVVKIMFEKNHFILTTPDPFREPWAIMMIETWWLRLHLFVNDW